MSDEKDRFGDKLRDAEKGREEQYFAERDRALLQKGKAGRTAAEGQQATESAGMRCPKCGEPLVTARLLDVTVEECPACRGLWLDKGDLERLAQRESNGWLARYFARGR